MYIKGVCVCVCVCSHIIRIFILFFTTLRLLNLVHYCRIYCTGFVRRTPLTVHKIEPFIFILLHIFFQIVHVYTCTHTDDLHINVKY